MIKKMAIMNGLTLILIVAHISVIATQDNTASNPDTNPVVHIHGNFSFKPAHHELGNIWEGNHKSVWINFPFCEKDYLSYDVKIKDAKIAAVGNRSIVLPEDNPYTGCHGLVIDVHGIRQGAASIDVSVAYENEDETDPCKKETVMTHSYKLVIMRPPKLEGKIFRLGVSILLVILNFGFGCSLDLSIVKEILKKPIAPAVGFCCQYIMMPLIGSAVSKTLLAGDPLFGFGLLCSSCAPGGAGSNVWCLLLGGDVSLSLTMTFFSLTASMFMMPFWLFILSRMFIDPSQVSIPYLNMLLQLTFFVIPCFFGVLLRRWKQGLADKLGRGIKPFSVIFIVYLLSFGIYVNKYVFAMWAESPRILLPALMQPYLGFTIGFTVGRFAAKQPRYRAITIAIETGIQNASIPMIMLQGSFEQPYGDLAATMPVTTALFTPVPLLFTWLGLMFYRHVVQGKLGYCVDAEKGKDEKVLPDDGVAISEKELEARAELKNQKLDKSYANGTPLHRPERDSLLVRNGLTGSALGRQFFMTDKESSI